MGILMVMLSAAMWGLSGVCGQFLFENYHPYPVWLIAVRQITAGLLFLLVMSPGESQGEGGENIVGWESRGRRD